MDCARTFRFAFIALCAGLAAASAANIDVSQPPYSADPTGATDTSAAFNAAIIAAGGGGTVSVPPGTYKALTDINININGVTLEAPTGATIVFGNPSGLQFFVRGNGNTVSNIAIDCAGSPFSGFVINGAGNKLQGCQASSCGVHGIVLDGQASACAGNSVAGCTVTGNGQIGIAQNHCPGNAITGNTASGNGDEGITADNDCQGAQIVDNTLTRNCMTGGVGGIGIDFSNGVTVSGNTVQGTSRGLPGLKTQNNLGPCDGLFVVGNTFSGNGGVAVWLFCNNGCTTGALVAGDTLTGNAATGNECGGQVQVDNPSANAVLC